MEGRVDVCVSAALWWLYGGISPNNSLAGIAPRIFTAIN